MKNKSRVILTSGFKSEDIIKIMNYVRNEFENPDEIIFAMCTENSVKMKLQDLLEHLEKEHIEVMKNRGANSKE